MFKVPEKYRVLSGLFSSQSTDGNNGCFEVKSIKLKRSLNVIASDGELWEHVSVSLHDRCPTWEEMCIVKSLFWDDDDLVIQMHPPESDWINNHNYCLHLWRKCDSNSYCERPPGILIGIKQKT